jgi:preprotein translocase subunit SecD
LKITQSTDRKQRFKNAFFIIMASYFTLAVTMLFLFFAGAGLLKGFALTTLIGATTGVLIARPAFAAAIEILTKDDQD